MKNDIKIYDKKGNLLKLNDKVFDGYDINTLEEHWDELYICSENSMWRLEEFRLDTYNDGIMLIDFEKNEN